jgi:hypothetical protein
MTTTANTEIRDLTADEIDLASGALQFGINLGLVRLHLSLTDAGVKGAVKVGDGEWHSGTIWFDDLPA